MRLNRGYALLFLFILNIVFLMPARAVAADETAVLIVADDTTKDAVTRKNHIFRTALVEFARPMLKKKLTPKAAEEILPKGSYKPQGRNTMKVWLNAANRADPPAQFLVGLRLVVSVIERTQSQVLEVILEANTHKLPSGEKIDTFLTDKPRRFALPNPCARKCVVQAATKAVKDIAYEAGVASAASIAGTL